MYTTATGEGAAYLRHWGVPAERHHRDGHPDSSGLQPEEGPRRRAWRSHGLAGDRPIVLQVAGGFGVGPIEKLYHGLLSVEQPLQIIVVTGRNEEAKAAARSVSTSPPATAPRCSASPTQIDELMAVADIVVSKPGGLTTSEVLASGAAMAIVNPIPGQESRNSDFLLENGAAIKINNIATLKLKLESLLADAPRLAAMKSAALKLAKPQAAFDVARLALKYADQGN